MILTCPSCTTRYMIGAAAIGEKGRVVRCANCQHEWFQEPLTETDDQDSEDLETENTEQEESVPEAIKPEALEEETEDLDVRAKPRDTESESTERAEITVKQKAVSYAVAAGLIGILWAGFLVFQTPLEKAIPQTEKIYQLFSGSDSGPAEGLIVNTLSARKEEGSNILNLSGDIMNLAQESVMLSGMVAIFKDKGGEVISEIKLPVEQTALKSGETKSFQTNFNAEEGMDIFEVTLELRN